MKTTLIQRGKIVKFHKTKNSDKSKLSEFLLFITLLLTNSKYNDRVEQLIQLFVIHRYHNHFHRS